MTREHFLEYCHDKFGTSPDYPFGDWNQTAVLRHESNRKWYALTMRITKNLFGFSSCDEVDIVNLKLPQELQGSFGAQDGVFPAYHMNKKHWISVLLDTADEETIKFLTNASHSATKPKAKNKIKQYGDFL